MAGGQSPVSAECSGINYALRIGEGTVEVYRRPFRHSRVVVKITRIKSIELLRKSIMPPAAVGAVGLSAGLALRIAEDELIGFVPSTSRMPLESFSFAVAFVCLVLLISRWFFGNLILRPIGMPAIVVRMVPTHTARGFVALVQRRAPISK